MSEKCSNYLTMIKKCESYSKIGSRTTFSKSYLTNTLAIFHTKLSEKSSDYFMMIKKCENYSKIGSRTTFSKSYLTNTLAIFFTQNRARKVMIKKCVKIIQKYDLELLFSHGVNYVL